MCEFLVEADVFNRFDRGDRMIITGRLEKRGYIINCKVEAVLNAAQPVKSKGAA